MNFFKSVFSEPDPPRDEAEYGDSDDEEKSNRPPDASDPEDAAAAHAPAGGGGGGWGFLIQTLTSKSESVIKTYRKDIEEFRSGLKKETEAIREAAARAVLDLPGSLEAGASAAQQSLETVGQAIDDISGSVWRGTAEIISQGKEALLAIDADSPGGDYYDSSGQPNPGSSKRYSRFEVQVFALQSDPNTFLEEPEDTEDLKAWKDGFELGDKDDEIDALCAENAALEGVFAKLVPKSVDYETFWTRYFYKVYKLKQAEDARAMLVKRVISREEEEEELSWEVDDDDEVEEEKLGKGKSQLGKADEKEAPTVQVANKDAPLEVAGETSTLKSDQADSSVSRIKPTEDKPAEKPEGITAKESRPKEKPSEAGETADKVKTLNITTDEPVSKSNDKLSSEGKTEPSEGKTEPSESCKDSDISVVSSQPSVPEDDDMGWDEIENLSDNDDKKPSSSDPSQTKVDLRKRLSAAEDDEDLSWDIEDD